VSQAGIVLDSNDIAISTVAFQVYPSVAFDGTNYLVVWEDYRNGIFNSDIFGARISRAGIVLDPNGIPIATGTYPEYCPAVAFDGTNYLVVWYDYRVPGDANIYGKRVNQAGVVLDSVAIAISTAQNAQYFPRIAFDSTNYLVVWVQERSYYERDIYGARVNQAGIVLDTTSIAISTARNWRQNPSVVFDGSNYLVVWQGRRWGNDDNIMGVRINPSGAVIDSFPVSTQVGNQESPKLAPGAGNQVLITYSGWIDSINHHPANTMRIWGKFYPFVGIAEENSKVKMQSAKLLEVYPNPAKTVMRVRVPLSVKEKTELKIYDVSGKLIKEIATPASRFAPQSIGTRSALRNDSELKISLKGISPGIYFLRVGKETKKFLVVK
jgi:hypothetical protein